MEVSSPLRVEATEVTCLICNKPFVNPKLLSCLHTFCQACIVKYRKAWMQGGHIFVCPSCKFMTKSSDPSGQDLPTNLYATGLLEIINNKKCRRDECQVCIMKEQKNNASYKCLDCGDNLCLPCSKGHNSSSSTSTHLVVALTDLRKGRYDLQLMRRPSSRCTTHKTDYLFYCNNCSVMICEHCTIAEHKHHGHIGIESARQQKQALLNSLIPQNNALRVITRRLIELDKEEKEFKTKLNMDVSSLVDQLHKERKRILKTSRAKFQEERRVLMFLLKTASVGAVGLYTKISGVGGNQLLAMSETLEAALKSMPRNDNASVKLPLPRKIRAEIGGYNKGTQIIKLIDERVSRETTDTSINSVDSSEDASKIPSKDEFGVEKTLQDEKELDVVTDGDNRKPNCSGTKWTEEELSSISNDKLLSGENAKVGVNTGSETESTREITVGSANPKSDAARLTMAIRDGVIVTGKPSTNVPNQNANRKVENTTGKFPDNLKDRAEDKDILKATMDYNTEETETRRQNSNLNAKDSTCIHCWTKDPKYKDYGEDTEETTVNELEEHTQDNITDTDSSLRNISSPGLVYKNHFHTRLKSDSVPPCISCMVFGPDESILVLDENNQKVEMFDKNFKSRISMAKSNHESFAPQITAYSDGFASARDKIVLFCRKDLKVTKAIYLCSDVNNLKTKYFPLMCSFQGGLLVGNLPGNEMRTYDVHGNILKSWQSQVPGPFMSLKYAHGDRVVISTWANNGAVYIESEADGIVFEKYHGFDMGNRVEPWYPWEACVTPAGSVIVSDSLRHEITVFSEKGNLLCVTSTRDYHVKEPRCLLLDDQNSLFVSASEGVVMEFSLCNV